MPARPGAYDESMAVPVVEARPAATVMLVRDSRPGIEVLMVRRAARGFFGGLTVFPGGAVEPIDRSDLADVVIGAQPDLELRVAALRELAEETGLALTPKGVVAAPSGHGADLFSGLRFAGIRLDATCLTLVSRWVTPDTVPTRFDTRFFLSLVGATPRVRLDPDELVDHMWVTPAEALEKESAGLLEMFLPTTAHLRWLERWEDGEQAIAAAHDADGGTVIRPRVLEDGSIVPIQIPGAG